jgi:hypothetical protein
MKHPFRLAVMSDLHIDARVDPASWDLAKRAFSRHGRERGEPLWSEIYI